MGSSLLDLKEELENNPNLKEELLSAANLDEAIEIARENGFDFDIEELYENGFAMDYIWELVTGGKGKNKIRNWNLDKRKKSRND